MKVVVAMDSFKGSLSAAEACAAVASGLESGHPGIEVQTIPIADGGEGTAAAMLAARLGEWVGRSVTGPLPEMQVEAGFAWFPDDFTAVVEMAAASGLTLLSEDERNPLRATTCGTGELIAAACDYGARRILLAVGGSATVDGGIGAAAALGWGFLDHSGNFLEPCGAALEEILTIIAPDNAGPVPVKVLCDVRNPLIGPEGAARVYGPQKGADPAMVAQLERGLANLAENVHIEFGIDIADLPGGGAAGGLAAGAVAFMNGDLTVGIDTVLDALQFDAALADADWVVTGEGCFDRQSLFGKAVAGVAARARSAGTPAAVIAGSVQIEAEEYLPLGIRHALPLAKSEAERGYAVSHAREVLHTVAERFARDSLVSRNEKA